MKYTTGVDQDRNAWPSPKSAYHSLPQATAQGLMRRLILAFGFATLFTLVGWRNINPYAFPDLENYRSGFESQWYLYTVNNLGFVDFLLEEGVWVRSFDALAIFVSDTELAFAIVSFVSLFLIAWYVISEVRSPIYLLTLINPGFVNLVLEQLRSGLATGIFLLAVRTKNAFGCLALCLLASSIHIAFWLLGGVLLVHRLVSMTAPYQAVTGRPISGTVAVLVAGLIIGIFRTAALAFIGDERAFIQEQYSSGLLLSLAWMLFGGWFAFHLKTALREFEAMFLLFGSMLAFVSAYQGLYGSRFFAIGATMFPVLLYRMPAQVRPWTAVGYAIFSGIWFGLWFQ